jgi:hypothetical protein
LVSPLIVDGVFAPFIILDLPDLIFGDHGSRQGIFAAGGIGPANQHHKGSSRAFLKIADLEFVERPPVIVGSWRGKTTGQAARSFTSAEVAILAQ